MIEGKSEGAWLLEQHRALTARYAARIGRGVAEDLASEAVARCWRHPAPDGRNGPWLERIFQNLLCDHHRRIARQARPGLLEAANMTDPEAALLAAERRAGLTRALAKVPEVQREVLRARFIDERDLGAVAAEAGIARETVRSRIHRGLARLRRGMGGLWAAIGLPLPAQPIGAVLVPAVLSALAIAPGLVKVESSPVAAPVGMAARPLLAQMGGARPTSPAPAPPSAATVPAPRRETRPARGQPVRSEPRPVARFDFANDDVVGELARPDGAFVKAPAPSAKQPSLIEIPSSFVAALAKSIDDL